VIHAAREAYAHQKTIGVSGTAVEWLIKFVLAGENLELLVAAANDTDAGAGGVDVLAPGLVVDASGVPSPKLMEKFLAEVGKHRAWGRDVSGVAA